MGILSFLKKKNITPGLPEKKPEFPNSNILNDANKPDSNILEDANKLDSNILEDANKIVEYLNNNNIKQSWQIAEVLKKVPNDDVLIVLNNNSNKLIAIASASLIIANVFKETNGNLEVNIDLVNKLRDTNNTLLSDLQPYIEILTIYNRQPQQWCKEMIDRKDFKTIFRIFKSLPDYNSVAFIRFRRDVKENTIKLLLNANFDLSNDLLNNIGDDYEIADISIIVILNRNFPGLCNEFYDFVTTKIRRKPQEPIDVVQFLDDYKNIMSFQQWYNETIIKRKYREAASVWWSHNADGDKLNKGEIDSKTYDELFAEWKRKTNICRLFLSYSGTDAVEGIVEELNLHGDYACALSEILLSTRDERGVPVIKKLLKEGYYDATSYHDRFVDFVNQYSEEKFKHKHD